MKNNLTLKASAALFVLLNCLVTFAGESTANQSRAVLGSAVKYEVVPSLQSPSENGEYKIWTERLHHENASFIKVHFRSFNLRAGDSLQIVSSTGRVVETLEGLGPKSRVNFWGLSVPGNTTELRFKYRGDYNDRPPFIVDRIIPGKPDEHSVSDPDASRSICQPNDMLDAACYLDDPQMAEGISASAGVFYINFEGGGEDLVGCSASNISANSTIMTNTHCFSSQLTCDDAEFIFKYRRSGCGIDTPLVDDWVSYRCDEVLVSSPVVYLENCAVPDDALDMTLFSVVGDPAAEFGYLELDTEPMTSGEAVYMVQHPNLGVIDTSLPVNTPQQVAVGEGADVVVDGNMLRYNNTMDTYLGSSGSPVIRKSNNKIVALHHCGGNPITACWNPDHRNNGILATLIAPLVADYTCSNALRLNYGIAGDLTQVVGNSNGSVDPGESWSFSTTAVNSTCAIDETGVTGEVILGAGVTEAVTISDDVLVFGDIAAGQSAQDVVTFSVPTSASCGANIAFDLIKLEGANSGGFDPALNALSLSLGTNPQSMVFTDSFDSGTGSWSIVDGGTGTGPDSTWTDQSTRSSSLTAPFLIVDSEAQGVGSVMDEELISQSIDVSGYDDVTLKFTHDFHYKGTNSTQEQGQVQVRSSKTNDVWMTVKTYEEATFTGTETFDITPFGANNLQIRFRYFNAEDDYFWAIDDVVVLAGDGFSCDVFDMDTDGDGVPDNLDNCTLVANADQRDTNQDGYGNICDPDLDNNGITNFLDVAAWTPFFGTSSNGDEDFTGDGEINFLDYIILSTYFINGNSGPGPSGIAP